MIDKAKEEMCKHRAKSLIDWFFEEGIIDYNAAQKMRNVAEVTMINLARDIVEGKF